MSQDWSKICVQPHLPEELIVSHYVISSLLLETEKKHVCLTSEQRHLHDRETRADVMAFFVITGSVLPPLL